MAEEEKLSLLTIEGGAVAELFDNALLEVMKNIHDINTTTHKREITIKATFKPLDENRNIIAYKVVCDKKLCGQEALSGAADLKVVAGKPGAYCRPKVTQSGLPLLAEVKPFASSKEKSI